MMTPDGDAIVVDALRALATDPPREMTELVYSSWVKVPGPVGDLYVAFTHKGIDYVRSAEAMHGDQAQFRRSYRERFNRPLREAGRPPAGLLSALQGRPTRSLRFDLHGLTAFEHDVLAAAQRIPTGQTRPYGWVARMIGRPRAVRAVGTALGNNPVPILIPCHRVTKSNGVPGEYVFGGEMKQHLLRAEGVDLAEAYELARRKVNFIGSVTTHIVCFPTCAHARRIASQNRRGFRSVAEAADAGYRPCLRCAPALGASA